MNDRFFTAVAPTRRTADAQRQIGELLLSLGVTPHTEGYAMLRDGARLLSDGDRCRRMRLTNELYPLLGESFERKQSRAEHAMRDAVRLAWQREEPEREALCCGETPSNAALLYLLAGYVQAVRNRNG